MSELSNKGNTDVAYIKNGKLLAEKGKILFPITVMELNSIISNADLSAVLQRESGAPYTLVMLNADQSPHTDAEPATLRELLFQQDDAMFAVTSRSWQVSHFMDTHRYCGKCGGKKSLLSHEVAMHCKVCDLTQYPRICPSIIVAITRGRELLLAKNARHPEGMMSILAGFNEAGESLEATLHREVMEEVGIKVHNVEYFNSQSWPFPHSLMVGYIAEYHSGDIEVDGEEILHADWFDIDDLPVTPPGKSIAGKIIAEVKSRGQK